MNSLVQPATAGRDVLVVEDEKRLRDMLVTAINDMLFRASAVASGEAAMRHLEQHNVDIILLDLILPGMSGMEFFSAIQKKHPQVGVIVHTGFGTLETALQAIRLNAVDFLQKPAPLKDLETALHRARDRRLFDKTHRVPVSLPIVKKDAIRLMDIERETILMALRRNGNRRDLAAEELGISERKLYYKIRQYQKQGHLP
jgi:DNA-binding NtrC family response regulator